MNYRLITPFLILAILTYLLFTGIGLSYSTVRIIANQITVKLIAPISILGIKLTTFQTSKTHQIELFK